jgi:hypothetical protein
MLPIMEKLSNPLYRFEYSYRIWLTKDVATFNRELGGHIHEDELMQI